jgi:hypothetical protein
MDAALQRQLTDLQYWEQARCNRPPSHLALNDR